MRDEDVRQRARITLGICKKCSNRMTKEELMLVMIYRGDRTFESDVENLIIEIQTNQEISKRLDAVEGKTEK